MGRIPNQPILVWLGVKNQLDFAFEIVNVHFLLVVTHISFFIPKILNQLSSLGSACSAVRNIVQQSACPPSTNSRQLTRPLDSLQACPKVCPAKHERLDEGA
jgi:hypothetical protein